MTDPLTVAYQNNTQSENTITEITESIEKYLIMFCRKE